MMDSLSSLILARLQYYARHVGQG